MLEPEKLTGKRLGRYIVLEQIATGGMATLYKARDTTLNRHVALKVLLSSLAVDSSMVARFHREAEATAKLSHPNIVPVYDVGEEEGVHYIAMEYVEGKSLSEIIAEEAPLDPDRAIGIVEQVAHGLAAAHEAELIHRDIKPGNILIDRIHRKERARITDFGLVQVSEGTRITDAHTLLGTAQYMSPEQCCGDRLDVSLTHQIVEEETVPIGKLMPNLPRELDKIVRKMMAKKVGDRYQSADELLVDIRDYTRKLEEPPWLRALTRAIAAVAVLALIWLGYRIWISTRLDRVAGKLMAEAEAQFDRGMTAEAADRFEKVLHLAGNHREAKLGLGYCWAELGNLDAAEKMFLNAGPDEGYDREGLAAVKYARGEYEEAMKLCKEVATEFPERAYVHTIEGNIHYLNGKLDEAIKEYDAATRKKPLFGWHRAVTHSNLGRAYVDRGDTARALEHYRKATETYNSRFFTDYALALQKANRNDEALTELDKAREIDPDDELATLLKAEVERRKAFEADEERRSRISKRIAELDRMYREGQRLTQPARSDMWTSRPMVLALRINDLAGVRLRAGITEEVAQQLTKLLTEGGRVQPVERELMEGLLQELELGSSALVDEDTALRLGGLFAANLVGIGSMDLFGNDVIVMLRIIETETSLKKIILVEQFEKGTRIGDIARVLADKISAAVVDHYPLRARIIELTDEGGLTVNIGSKQGLQPEICMDVFTPATDRKGMTMRGKRVGRVEISSVEQNQAIARVIEGSDALQKGMLLVEVPTKVNLSGRE